jgi:hypothetical protein
MQDGGRVKQDFNKGVNFDAMTIAGTFATRRPSFRQRPVTV